MNSVVAFGVDQISPPMTRNSDGNDENGAPVFLLIGACALDRLLTVSSYPAADAKIRTTSYSEVGGGNAANTASAIGKLIDSELLRTSRVSPTPGQKLRVKLLTKVGDDKVGDDIVDELNASNVETSSQLFRRGKPGSTTSFTTIIVGEIEQTRTCFHTPGTCGELSLQDVESLTQDEIEEVFRNVIHLHTDSRHTDVSLWVAKEAKKRGITVSCDCEKDRQTKSLDQLIEVCDILFTNSNHLGDYLERLTCEREAETGREHLSIPTITIDNKIFTTLPLSATELQQKKEQELIETYVRSLTPSMYFARWQRRPAIGKEVVVTHGSKGALYFKQISSTKKSMITSTTTCGESKNTINVESDKKSNSLHLRHSFKDGEEVFNMLYEVHQVGTLNDCVVMDTTGAGDAFIGAYILMSNMSFDEQEEEAIGSKVQFALEMGSFVGGRKVEGPGARAALPTGRDIDSLGSNIVDVRSSIHNALGGFNDADE